MKVIIAATHESYCTETRANKCAKQRASLYDSSMFKLMKKQHVQVNVAAPSFVFVWPMDQTYIVLAKKSKRYI